MAAAMIQSSAPDWLAGRSSGVTRSGETCRTAVAKSTVGVGEGVAVGDGVGDGVASGVASGESKGNKGVPVTGVCACTGALHATVMMSAHKVQNRRTRPLHAAG